ncbi:uncharacterized protein LOC117173859 [Belonocnema kinseyi]|uniref:uncharacterized protein LOC117173859 n=1 Tax=Belonocnema kinseyi TaxID=2817044 RepID=UPI00143CC71F|nr:uncharacterized protein LOC117173859 [Belonocnema kinseyi]
MANLRAYASSRSSTPVIDGSSSCTNFPLPKLQLPTFSGSYEERLGFRDSFVAIIEKDASIPKIQKLRYLRSYVRDNASRVTENLQATEANYEVAWKLLDERYNNKRIIIHNHMQALIGSPALLNKESAVCLRNLLDTALRHVRALKVLEEPTNK